MSIFLTRKEQDEIIAVAYEKRTTHEPRLHDLLDPFIEHFVQVDVRENGRNNTTLGAPRLRIRQHSVFQDPRLQPFANQSQQHAVAYPAAKNRHQMSVSHGVEELAD